MKKKRTRLEVMHDILEVVRNRGGKIKPTQILYKSNLSYQMMGEYIQDLIAKGLLIESITKNGRTYYVTEKGMEFLMRYGIVEEFTVSFGLTRA